MQFLDDSDVIRDIQSGDTESFALLVEKYHTQLLNFIYRLMGNDRSVEDLGQDVFLSIYKSIRRFDVQRGVPFSAWLFITARNRCISELRKKKKSEISMEKAVDLRSPDQSPEQAASQNERISALREALAQLPDPYRQTLLQSVLGDSPEEIAAHHKISPGTVKSRLSRAREKLRFLLHTQSGGKKYEQV
jgi:RNA polymerase sigma-70 factor, ECF subfamily